MNRTAKQIVFWLPRALSILFALFISMFALDVFNEGFGFWRTLLALLIHLIPTALVIVAILLSWRWEWVGAFLFILLGSYYLFTNLKHPAWILVISGPLLIIGFLFIISRLYCRDLRTSS